MREIAVVFDLERKLFLYLGLVALAIVLGPFGTYDSLALWPRVTFWALDILGAAVIIVPILHIFYYSRFTRSIPSFLRLSLGTALGAFPAAAYVALICETIGASLHLNLPLPEVYLYIVVLGLLTFLVEFIIWPKLFGDDVKRAELFPGPSQAPVSAPSGTNADPTLTALQPLSERLPAELRGGRLISISMQDHYAHVVTTKGEHLLLIRLKDAIDLASAVPGARIHRSHWAAAEFAEALERDGRRHLLVLSDGRKMPVSATYLDDARALITPDTTRAAAQ